MFLPALLVGVNGEWVRGGVEVEWVNSVFNDHDNISRPTRLYVEDEREVEKVQRMTLIDVWVDLLAVAPESLKFIPRAVEGEECEELN